MDSTIFNRRTLLGSGALVGLGALLAACGQQANNEAAATASAEPSQPTEQRYPQQANNEAAATASAAPNETVSASAAASDAASTSATPSPVITRGYSGGSKAPDGEYRKADAKGPAQNVPKPRNEPAQYPENEEGLSRMMEDWLNAHNYAIQTGNCALVIQYVEKTSKEYPFYEYIEDLYKRGGWVVDGLDSYQVEGDLIYDDKQKIYRMKFRRFWSTVMYVDSDGEITKRANTDKNDDLFNYFFKHTEGYWKIIGSGTENNFKVA